MRNNRIWRLHIINLLLTIGSVTAIAKIIYDMIYHVPYTTRDLIIVVWILFVDQVLAALKNDNKYRIKELIKNSQEKCE